MSVGDRSSIRQGLLIGVVVIGLGCMPVFAGNDSLKNLGQQLLKQAVTALEQKYLRVDTAKKTLALSPDVLRLFGQMASRRAGSVKELSIDPAADNIGIHLVNNLGVGFSAKIVPEELLVGLDSIEVNGRMAENVQVDQLSSVRDSMGGFLDSMLGVSEKLSNLPMVSRNIKIEGRKFSFRRPVNVSPVGRILRGSVKGAAATGPSPSLRLPLRLEAGWLVLDGHDVQLPAGTMQAVMDVLKSRLPQGLLGGK